MYVGSKIAYVDLEKHIEMLKDYVKNRLISLTNLINKTSSEAN